MLKQRIITALLLAATTVAAIFLLPLQFFMLVCGAVFLLGAKEWSSFVSAGKHGTLIYPFGLLLGLLLIAVPLPQIWNVELNPVLQYILAVAAVWWFFSLLLVFKYPASAKWWSNNKILKALFGLFTLIPFFWALVVLRSINYQTDPFFGAWLVMYVMLLVWGADTGAYFVGKALGKRKLAPNVSPGKTIEGFLGGLATSTLVALAALYFLEIDPGNTWIFIVISVLTALASSLGDLNESMFKREAGIKDSGNLLPGHGGILDRIDSLTAALPVFTLCFIAWL